MIAAMMRSYPTIIYPVDMKITIRGGCSGYVAIQQNTPFNPDQINSKEEVWGRLAVALEAELKICSHTTVNLSYLSILLGYIIIEN